MKTISADLKTHLAGEVITLATCWKLTLKDATVMGFTDHDKNITFNSVVYLASASFSPTAVSSGSHLAVDNLNIEGILDSSAITEEDILAGKYDFAEVEIFKLNYANLTQGKLTIRRGWLGEITLGKNSFVAELNGLTQRLSKTIGELYSPACRAKLGDAKCGINMTSYTQAGSVTSVTSNQVFTDTSRAEAAGYFNNGLITWTSGNNNGISMEVKEYISGSITLVLPMSYDVATGDTYSMEAGCNKTFEICKATFSNAVNFRGEPHVPGTDKILETSSTRSS